MKEKEFHPKGLASLDVFVDYKLGDGFKFCNIEPYLEGGTGYTWFGSQKSVDHEWRVLVFNTPLSEKVSLKSEHGL